MDDADELRQLRERIERLERANKGLISRLELLDSAVTVTRHGREQLSAELRLARRALEQVDMNLAAVPVLLAQLQRLHPDVDVSETVSCVRIALDLVEAALRDPVG